MADLKISALVEQTAPATTDLSVIVDDPGVTPVTKKITLANLSKGIVVANMPDFKDQDYMADNSATAVASQQSVAAAIGGWLKAGLSGVTVTRQSIDNPTVVLRFNADVTDYIWKGMRIKATENSIVHYFIVSADPVFSSPNTDVTCLSEIDTTTPTQAKNLIGTGTISDVAYAPPKTYPKGFPIDVMSWTLELTSNSNRSTTNTTLTSLTDLLVVVIGLWKISFKASVNVVMGGGTTGGNSRVTLSSDATTETNPKLTIVASHTSVGTGTKATSVTSEVSEEISLSSKTTFTMMGISSASITTQVQGSTFTPTVIKATSTLL
jgi:hypothetical protein